MSQLKYRAEIDGLRAIAVTSVVLYHADLFVHAGQTGVDVFFVISGYLITLLLYREWSATGSIDFPAFYARRVRRIIPALTATVICTVAASAVLLSRHGESTAVTQSAAAALLFGGNFYFQMQTGGYFDSSAEFLPLLHLWSLGVEEQFYLVWPVVLLLVLRYWPRAVFPIIWAGGLASLALAEILIVGSSNAAFYEMPPRFWELAAGGLVALRAPGGSSRGGMWASAGLAMTVAAALIPIGHFPGIGALPAVIGAVLTIYGIHEASPLGWAGAVLRWRPMVFLGLISYSLYLWHWPLLAIARAKHVGELPLFVRLGVGLAAVGLAWLSYRYVEQPLRRPNVRTSNPKLISVTLMALIVLALNCKIIGAAIYRPPAPTNLAFITGADQPSNRIRCNYTGLDPIDVFPRPGCTSAEDKPVRVAIWGDSHALAWQPFAWALARSKGVAAASYTRDACAPALGYDNGKRALEAERCRSFNELVANHLAGIETLVVTASWPTDPMFAESFENTIATITSRVGKIILLGPTPLMRDSVPKCIAEGNLAACEASRQDFDDYYRQTRLLLRSLARQYANVEYVDPADFFCNQEACPALKDGYGLYWDSNHVATKAARIFAEQYLASAH